MLITTIAMIIFFKYVGPFLIFFKNNIFYFILKAKWPLFSAELFHINISFDVI